MADTRLSGPRFPLTFQDGQALTAAELNALQNGLLDVIRKHTHGAVDGPSLITAGAIAPGAVNETHLAYNAVRKGHIVTGAVGRSELRYGAVQEQHLDDLAVTTPKVKDQQITEAKLAPQVQAKLNAARDGASTFGYCAYLGGDHGYEPELGQESWTHWLFDKVSITKVRPLQLERLQQDGTWASAERVEPERIKVLSRAELAQRLTTLFNLKGALIALRNLNGVAAADGNYELNLSDGTHQVVTPEYMILYIERFKELTNQDYGSLPDLIRKRQLGQSIEPAVAAALPPYPYYPQYKVTRVRYDGIWHVHYEVTPAQYMDGQMSTQDVITNISSNNGGQLPAHLAEPLNQLLPLGMTTSINSLSLSLRQYFDFQWFFAPVTNVATVVTPQPDYHYQDWAVSWATESQLLTDDVLKGVLRRYVGDAEPFAQHLFDLVPYLPPRVTHTAPAPTPTLRISAPPTLPGEVADRTHVRLTVDPAKIHWAMAAQQINVFHPGIKGNSAFTDNGQEVVFALDATPTPDQEKTALRILNHFAVTMKTGFTVTKLLQLRHTVRLLNNPHLVPAGYWTGTTRNIRAVTLMARPVPDSEPLPFVRVLFETPYHDSTYAVSVTLDYMGGNFLMTPAVLARTREYVDLVFFGPNGQFELPTFTLTINGELNHA